MTTHHGMKQLGGLHELCSPNSVRSGRFGRMFPELAPLYLDPRTLSALGDRNGPMRTVGAAQKTASVAVGQAFFGQFIDHDITLDLSSSFARLDRPEGTENFRTPSLDLDCVYGDGPEGSPFLYWDTPVAPDSDFNGIKLLVGADALGASPEAQQDLARSVHGRAIIGDPRNDENRVVSQLQLGFIRFHNRVADTLHAEGLRGEDLAHECRRVTTWHYQWVVLRDFLPTLVGAPLVDDVLGRGRQLFHPEDRASGDGDDGMPFIPVEFSVAAYRFGHSMIPQLVQVQPGKPALRVFGPTLGQGFSPLTDLEAVVDWNHVLDLAAAGADRADKLDAILAPILLDLPFVNGSPDEKSLATRNLLRAQAFLLPSGETVAEACGRPQAEIDQVTNGAEAMAAAAGTDLSSGTPLWLYTLIEGAEIGRETNPGNFDQGEGLGPVAGRIVAETLIGLMELDPDAFLGGNRAWSPDGDDKLGANGVHTLLELLTY